MLALVKTNEERDRLLTFGATSLPDSFALE